MDIPQKKIARKALIYSIIFPVMLLQLSYVQAQLPDPEVMFIPNQISAESSFVMVADPGSVGGSVRITWVTDEGYGHFPYIDGKYMCYFSDTDYESTCGPSPFRYPTTEGFPYLLDLFTYDSQGNEGNASVDVDVGGLKIVPDVTIDFDKGSVIMLVYTTPSLAESVKYRVFDSEFDPKTSGYLSLNRIAGTPYYNGSVELDPGVYYIAYKANSSTDYGGGIIKVTMAGDGDGDGVPGGVLQADPINIDVLVEAGSEPNLPQNKRVINTLNQSFTGLTVSLPADIAKYLTISIPNASIGAYESVYYSIDLHGISSSHDFNTIGEIKSSGGTVLGRIPIEMRISYTSGGITDCSQLSDGAYCLGGICCGGVCREKAECCVDSDCTSGTCSQTTFRCLGTTDIPCTTGTCRTDILICPVGESETGDCVSGGVSGICCSPEAGECTGVSDLTPCSLGICCSDVCEDTTGTECCLSIDCPGDELCENNMCVSPNGPGPGIDFFSIGIIIAILALAGLGGWWFFKKYKKKSPEEEEFGGEEPKEDEGLVEGEEEFY
jgi:hypothetical protein